MARQGTHFETLSQGPRPMKSASGATLSKTELRRQLRTRRAQLPIRTQRSAAIQCAQVLTRHRWFRSARHIGVYLDVGSELSTAPLIETAWSHQRSIYLPRIRDNGQMDFYAYRPGQVLRGNRHGIAEPVGRRRRSPRQLDLIIIPLVGFDRHGYRLGAGGGYYDRLLTRCLPARPLRIGYAFSAQEVPELPHEPWDQQLHAVVTERGLQRFTHLKI